MSKAASRILSTLLAGSLMPVSPCRSDLNCPSLLSPREIVQSLIVQQTQAIVEPTFISHQEPASASIAEMAAEQERSTQQLPMTRHSRRGILKAAASLAAVGVLATRANSQEPSATKKEAVRRRIVAAAQRALTGIEGSGWLQPNPHLSNTRLQELIAQIRDFVQNPVVDENATMISSLRVDPITKRLQVNYQVASDVSDMLLEQIIVHEFFHRTRQNSRLLDENYRLLRTISGASIDNPQIREDFKRVVALAVEAEFQAYRVEYQYSAHVGYRISPGLQSLLQTDPNLEKLSSRVRAVTTPIVISERLLQGLRNLHRYELANRLTAIPNFDDWVAYWIENSKLYTLPSAPGTPAKKGEVRPLDFRQPLLAVAVASLYPDFSQIRNPNVEPVWGEQGNLRVQDLPYLVELHATALERARSADWSVRQTQEEIILPFKLFYARAVLNGAKASGRIPHLDLDKAWRDLTEGKSEFFDYLKDLEVKATADDAAALDTLQEYGELERFIFVANLEADLYMSSLWTLERPGRYLWDATHTFAMPFQDICFCSFRRGIVALTWLKDLKNEGIAANSLARIFGTIWGQYRRKEIPQAARELESMRKRFPYYGEMLMRQLRAMVSKGDLEAQQILDLAGPTTKGSVNFEGPFHLLPRANAIIASQAPSPAARDAGLAFIREHGATETKPDKENLSGSPTIGGSGLATIMLLLGTFLTGASGWAFRMTDTPRSAIAEFVNRATHGHQLHPLVAPAIMLHAA